MNFQKIKNLFLKILIFISILLFIDIIFFYFLPKNIKVNIIDSRAHRIKSYYYHHDLRPNSYFKDHWGFEDNIIFTNNLGFKDIKTKKIKFKEKNILFIGDSFTEGVGLKYQDTFVGIIENKIINKNNNYQVLNAGVQSYSPKIYYSKIYDILIRKKYPITHVVILISGGDIFDDYFRYKEVNDKKILLHKDHQNEFVLEIINFIKGNTLSYQFIANITPPRVIPNKIKEFFSKNNKKEKYIERSRNIENKEILKLPFLSIQDYDYLYKEEAFKTWGKKGIDQSYDYLEKISQLTSNKKIKLDILYAKDAILILKKPIHEQLKYTLEKFKSLEKYPNTNFHYLSNYHNEFQDPFDAYKKLFFIEDHHWNKMGNLKVSQEILSKVNF